MCFIVDFGLISIFFSSNKKISSFNFFGFFFGGGNDPIFLDFSKTTKVTKHKNINTKNGN